MFAQYVQQIESDLVIGANNRIRKRSLLVFRERSSRAERHRSYLGGRLHFCTARTNMNKYNKDILTGAKDLNTGLREMDEEITRVIAENKR